MQAKAEQNVMFSISPTINLFNVKTTPEFVDWLFSKGLPMHNIHLNNVLTNPQWYHVNLLLDSDKEEIKQKFDQHLATVPGDQKDDLRSKYNSIIEYMVLDNYLDGDGMHDMDKWRKSSLRAKFYEVTSLLDNHREESFPQVFPELENFYQEAKQEYRRTKK